METDISFSGSSDRSWSPLSFSCLAQSRLSSPSCSAFIYTIPSASPPLLHLTIYLYEASAHTFFSSLLKFSSSSNSEMIGRAFVKLIVSHPFSLFPVWPLSTTSPVDRCASVSDTAGKAI